ncbi:hypothetical protein LXA47_03785 [Massilia sp. P8910]|uniref:hypothetical protein n=1 Tax=Massilia antarctica TaxID=2765360 RepID=UPI001E412E75|nr:hypothetical protein [Massilia antarctica]MCE3602719.1 hypothetical protein [Massilia antarctica]
MLLEKFNKETGYNPDGLLDGIKVQMAVKNDAALARMLQIGAPLISKVRHRKAPVTAGLLLRMHEVTKMPVPSLRRMMGVPAR